MDLRSSGAILKILNLIALADGRLSLEEEHLLDSLASQYKLQAKINSWEDALDDPTSITALAKCIAEEDRALALKTGYMVAGITREKDQDIYICPEEDVLLSELAGALALAPEAVEAARQQGLQELNKQPTLWQVLYGCFGSRFQQPLFG